MNNIFGCDTEKREREIGRKKIKNDNDTNKKKQLQKN
jgi:hypothetical protein